VESGWLPGVAFTEERRGEHSSLIKAFADDIEAFLAEGRSFAESRAQEVSPRLSTAPAAAVLAVSLSGRAAPLVVDPGGARCGVQDGMQQSYEETAGCTIVRGAKGGGVTIPDPSNGTYTVQLSGDAAEDVLMTVSYLNEETGSERRFDLFYPGTPIAFSFALDALADPALQVTSQPPEPKDLQALPVDAAGGQATELTWSAVTDPELAGYRVYSRRDDEPVLAFLAATGAGAPHHATGHAWNEPRRIYAVSAVNRAGKESFLSTYVENRAFTVADFSATPLVGEAPLNVRFQDGSSGQVTGWQWDFGDGTQAAEQHPAHTYGSAGSYTVRLAVTGEEGEDLKIREAYITLYEPVSAAFQAAPVSGPAPLTVHSPISQREASPGGCGISAMGGAVRNRARHTHTTPPGPTRSA
jgi:hypothetical protein